MSPAADYRERRMAVGMTQESLATQAGISSSALRRIEHGAVKAQATTEAALERVLARAEAIAPRYVGPIPVWTGCDEPRDEDGDELHWYVPPECQGQIVERAYAISGDCLYRRRRDRSNRSVEYAVRGIADGEEPDPLNREPR